MTVLTFDHPAEAWLEALPLGNGRLGAMCYGGTDRTRFDINDETAWSGSPGSECGQPRLDAAASVALLTTARALLAQGRFADAEDSVKAMQSDHTQSYLPFATVTLQKAPSAPPDYRGSLDAPTDYRRSLDLASATHEVRYRESGAARVRRTIVSARHGVLVHLVEGEGAHADVGIEITTPLRTLDRGVTDHGDGCETQVVTLRLPSDVPPSHAPGPTSASWSERPGACVEGAIAVRTVRELLPHGRTRLVVFLTTETTFGGLGRPLAGSAADAAARAVARLDAAVRLGAETIVAQHSRDYAELFSRVSLRLEAPTPDAGDLTTPERMGRAFADPRHPLAADPGLAAVLFDYGRYLLLSSSRPGGLPATLQGIWNDSMQPPWSSNYTLNINLEMNYWQANVANLPETAEPLIDFIVALSHAGAPTASRLYGARGWVAHHNSDAWLYTAPVGARAGDPAWSFWPMAGPWLVRHLWDGVEFGMIDEDEVRARLWPVIRGAAEFALDWLVRMPDGGWGTIPSTSPENTFVAPDGSARGLELSSALDLTLLRDLFRITLAAAALIDIAGDPVVAEARTRLAELADVPRLDVDGDLLEWSQALPEVDPLHRHVSPLYFVYPGRGDCDDAHRDAAVRMLERRGDASTGWSLVWKLALWARLGRPQKVSDLVRLFFQPAAAHRGPWAGGLYPNLFAAHPPFQIDGNLGYVAALAESLLQSHAGVIDLLPALAPELGTGEVTGLVARPGVIVDIRWRDGALQGATLRARQPTCAGRYRIRHQDRTVERLITASAVTELVAADFAGETTQHSTPSESET